MLIVISIIVQIIPVVMEEICILKRDNKFDKKPEHLALAERKEMYMKSIIACLHITIHGLCE